MIEELAAVEHAIARARDGAEMLRLHATGVDGYNAPSRVGILEGALALGVVMWSPQAMFEAGTRSVGVVTVHTRDRLVWELPEALVRCASRLFEIQQARVLGTSGVRTAWAHRTVNRLRGPDVAYRGLDVAPRYSAGRDIQLSTAMPCRSHLPNERMSSDLMPMIVPRRGDEWFRPFVVHRDLWPGSWRNRFVRKQTKG